MSLSTAPLSSPSPKPNPEGQAKTRTGSNAAPAKTPAVYDSLSSQTKLSKNRGKTPRRQGSDPGKTQKQPTPKDRPSRPSHPCFWKNRTGPGQAPSNRSILYGHPQTQRKGKNHTRPKPERRTRRRQESGVYPPRRHPDPRKNRPDQPKSPSPPAFPIWSRHPPRQEAKPNPKAKKTTRSPGPFLTAKGEPNAGAQSPTGASAPTAPVNPYINTQPNHASTNGKKTGIDDPQGRALKRRRAPPPEPVRRTGRSPQRARNGSAYRCGTHRRRAA